MIKKDYIKFVRLSWEIKKEDNVPKKGLYETEYGNACEYTGGDTAYDLDMQQTIPVEMVDFNKFIRKLNKGELICIV